MRPGAVPRCVPISVRNQAEAVYTAERGLAYSPRPHVPSNVVGRARKPEAKWPRRRGPRVALVEPPGAGAVAGDRTEQRRKAHSVPVMDHRCRPELEAPPR